MNRFLGVSLAILVLVVSFSMLPQQATAQVAEYAPTVGQPHPDFILPSVDDGEAIQLSAYRGKKVLLMHFASW